jgi:hypothetical protein
MKVVKYATGMSFLNRVAVDLNKDRNGIPGCPGMCGDVLSHRQIVDDEFERCALPAQ